MLKDQNFNKLMYSRMLSGFGVADATDTQIETSVENIAKCTGLAEQEVISCLIDNPYSCPEGYYADFISHFCEMSADMQKKILSKQARIVDYTHVIRQEISGAAGSSLDLIKSTTKKADGLFSFEDGGKTAKDQYFVVSGIQIRYGEVAQSVGASNPLNARYGIVRNETTSGVTDLFVLVPTSLLNSDYTVVVGGKTILDKMPLTHMSNFNQDMTSIGYRRIDSHFMIKEETNIVLRLNPSHTLAPINSTVAQFMYIEILLHGAITMV